MTKKTIITCDECQKEVNDLRGYFTVSFDTGSLSGALNCHMHFCEFTHMIDYLNRKSNELKECEHESDGMVKDNSGSFELGCNKCKKCGKFYK